MQQQQQESTSPQELEGRVLRSFEHGTRRKRDAPHIAAAEANEEGKDDAQCALDREALTSAHSPSSILEEDNDSSILHFGVSKKRPRTVRRELPGLEEVLQDLESDPWFALQQQEQQQQLKQHHNVVHVQTEEADARNQNVQSDPQTRIYSQESNQVEDDTPEAVMSKLRSLAPQIMQRRSKVGDDTGSIRRRWVKKAAPLELPTMTMITPRTRKKIESLPRPGPAELARLAEIDETFLSMDQEREIGHAAGEKQTLYSKLWIVARKRAYDLHMLPPVPLRDRVKAANQPLGKKRKVAKARESKIPEAPKMRRSPRRDQEQAAGDLQDRENELAFAEPRVSMLRDRLQRADAATEAARGRIGELLQETRSIVPATALFEHRLKNLLSAASRKNQNKLQRMLTRLVRKYQRAQLLPSWNKWRGAIDSLRMEAQNAAARRIQSLFTKASCKHELEERERQQIRQRERHEVQLAHRIELRRRGPEPLQRAFRKYCARRELAYLRRRREAVVCVQCAWRARNCRIVLAALQAAKLHRNQSATHIQRVFRGHCARVRAGLLRKIEAVTAKERARLAAQAAIEARLMRIGAAALMQGWWRSLQRRWLTRAMVMVMKRRAAIRIQSFWRSVWAVLELKRAIARKRDQDARESAAATMLQKRFRIRRAQALVERIRVEAAEAKAQRDASRIENMQDRTMNIFGRTLNVTKNRRALHELRSKIDPFMASRQERAATRIQRVWRGYRARRRVKRRRAAENQVLSKLRRDKVRAAALQMQKRWRGIRERRRLEMERQNRAASLIQAKYRARIGRRNFLLILERHKAASRVQKRWRGRLARKMMVLFREEMRVQNAAARVCQRAVQRYLFRKGYRDRLENERTWFELRQQGAIETILAKRAEGYRMLLHSGFLNSAKGGGELRALFCELSEPLAQLSGDKFVKMVLACPGLAHLERKTLDIIFAKAKKPDSKLLGYPEFRESLIGLGMHLYVAEGVDAKIKAYKDTVQAERAKAKRGRFSGGSSGAAQSAEAARAQRQAEKDADKKAETQIRDEAIGQFTFRRHRGRRGLLLRVLHEHIWNMEFAQRHREALDARAARRMEWASVMVQRRFRGVASRSILDRIREQRQHEIEAERQRAASTLIQTFWRMCLAKRRVRALARRCLQKCIDAETGDPYWFNTQTGESSWTKPKLLGDDEAEVSIVMPQKDDEFVIKCAKCRAEMATVACLDCADPFCEDCHRQEHHGATMHTNIPIPLCTECNFQAATRNCTPCQRKFCCSCFEMAHFISPPWQDEPVCAQPSEEQSQLAAHKWQPLIKVCAECDARAVRWRCEECGDDFCARCLKDLHRKGNRRLHNFHPLSYHSLQLEVRERQVRAKKRAIAEKERRKVMQKQAEQDNMEKVALKLQSLYRGRRDRAVGKSLLRDARLRERKHWRLVKHDMAERKKLNYRLQAAVGIAPILETDDDETKDRKRMGWKATPWGRAAVAAGVALPIGEPLPGPIKVHDNETLFIHVIEEWRSLISVDEYIRLDNQYFLVKHIGEQDENDPGKPVDTVQMMREEKLRKRQENDPWAVAAASEESSTAGETGKSKKKNKNKKKKKKKSKDQNSGEDQDGEVGPEGVEDDSSAKESKATENEREKKKRARRAIMNKAKQVKKKGFQACTLQIHLDAPYSGEIPVEVRGFFVGSFNLAQDAIVKAKRADKQAIKEKMGGRLADVMAKTKEFIAEKADEYIDPDTAARLNKRFTGVARLVGKRRSSIASIEDMDDEDLGEAEEAQKVSTPPKSATQAAKASLPPGWEEFLDDASGTPYFYNHSTGESVWERPSE